VYLLLGHPFVPFFPAGKGGRERIGLHTGVGYGGSVPCEEGCRSIFFLRIRNRRPDWLFPHVLVLLLDCGDFLLLGGGRLLLEVFVFPFLLGGGGC